MRTALTLLLLITALAGPAQAQGTVTTWTVDGTVRRAIVFAPLRPPPMPLPLVFVFHGAGDTADNFTGVDFQHAWPDALIVYMDGLGRVAGGGGAFQTNDPSAMNRDLKFVDFALADLRKHYPVDARRVYAAGFSNGAKFVYLLWATRPGVFAAFAPVAGMLTARAPLTEPKPVIAIGGRADRQNDFSEQLASIELARTRNGATGKGRGCGVNCLAYGGKEDVVTVLHPGGHFYPADATQLIVAFFRQQGR